MEFLSPEGVSNEGKSLKKYLLSFFQVDTVTVTFLPAFHCPGSVM